MPEAAREPSAVVLVPTLNNASDLEPCLAALAAQEGAVFETVVVDSRANPACAAIAARYGARYIEDSSPSRAAACNYALRILDCDIVLFTDDDCYPPPSWVHNIVRHFAREEVAGVGGPHIAPRNQSYWGRVVDVAFASPLLSIGLRYAKTYDSLREVPHNPGCNAAYRKHVLDEVGGFTHAPFGAEDVALDHLITSRGYRLWFDPEAVTFHRRRDRFATIARQMWAYGRGRADTNARYPAVARWTHMLPSAALIGAALLLAFSMSLALAAGIAKLGAASALDHHLLLELSLLLPIGATLLGYFTGMLSAALSSSPYRSLATVAGAPLIMALSVFQYGRGFIHWHRVLKASALRVVEERT